MDCPKCRTATLHSVAPYSSEPPHRCTTCGGIWVYLQDVPQLLGGAKLGPGPEVPEGNNRDGQAGLCPNNHGILSRAKIELDQTFYLDRCMTCAGVWFDQGEWEKLATAHLLDNLGYLWTDSWQRQQRATQQQLSRLSLAEQKFGQPLLTQLLELAAGLKDHPRREEALVFLREQSGKPG